MKTVPGKLSMTVVYLVLFHGWLGLANAENVKTFPLNTIEGTEAVEVTAKTANLKGRDGLPLWLPGRPGPFPGTRRDGSGMPAVRGLVLQLKTNSARTEPPGGL